MKEIANICTNFIVFLHDSDCTNCIVFLQEEKETVDMCTNCIVFLQEEKERLYKLYCFSVL